MRSSQVTAHHPVAVLAEHFDNRVGPWGRLRPSTFLAARLALIRSTSHQEPFIVRKKLQCCGVSSCRHGMTPDLQAQQQGNNFAAGLAGCKAETGPWLHLQTLSQWLQMPQDAAPAVSSTQWSGKLHTVAKCKLRHHH